MLSNLNAASRATTRYVYVRGKRAYGVGRQLAQNPSIKKYHVLVAKIFRLNCSM